jgi:anthranilate synthase component 2
MGIRHKRFEVEGIQFHPESIMTPVGKRLLRNFLTTAGAI